MKFARTGFKTRKDLRKEARKAKKQRRNDYYIQRSKRKVQDTPAENLEKSPKEIKSKLNNKFENFHEERDYEIKKERKQRETLNKKIKKKRIEQLKEDNLEEEKQIKKLEKQLKFRKGKRSGAFTLDGLDYLLDICDHKITNNKGEKAFHDSDSEFDNDLATVTRQNKDKNKVLTKKNENDFEFDSSISSDEADNDLQNDSDFDDDNSTNKYLTKSHKNVNISESEIEENAPNSDSKRGKKAKKRVRFDEDVKGESDDEDEDGNMHESSDSLTDSDIESDNSALEPFNKKLKIDGKVNLKVKSSSGKSNTVKTETNIKNKKCNDKVKKINPNEDVDEMSENTTATEKLNGDKKLKKLNAKSKIWEDIYGRLRDEDGNVIQTYKPPQLRKIMTNATSSKNQEKLLRLRKQLKGLLNRLAENNMASISSQIEELYMSNSRNEMNETLKNLFSEAMITEVLTPEKLVAEHAMLIAILNANVGSEIGAYFLQFTVTQIDQLLKQDHLTVEDKTINNHMLFLMYLYSFKICHSKLIYDILNELLKNLQEKQIELVLLTLRTVGFSLRKDDPIALKSVVLKVQEKANSVTDSDQNYSRMKYMLEVVSAVKNNNVSKIPNYNPELVEHLKKCMKVMIRKGNYNNELNISLQDLLNAEEHGRWWVVGSAWSGAAPNKSDSKTSESTEMMISKKSFSQKLLDLAKEQRMNTDVRRTIFCTLMSAEDYLDAFEKLLKLGLKGAVEREIVNVLLHCAMQEKEFNPYYFHLGNKFCIFNRRFQMMLQCAVWDKLKELNNMLAIQVTNLAKFLGSIIASKGLPLSVLKVIHFSELDKVAVKFIRQVLLTILIADEETVVSAFSRIIQSPKLKVFRDGIRLFLHHFLLKNVKSKADENSDHLIKMIEVADKTLTSSDAKLVF